MTENIKVQPLSPCHTKFLQEKNDPRYTCFGNIHFQYKMSMDWRDRISIFSLCSSLVFNHCLSSGTVSPTDQKTGASWEDHWSSLEMYCTTHTISK